MIEEGTRARLDVLDVPLPLTAPELAVPPADDLTLEADGCGRGRGWGGRVVTLAVPPNTDDARGAGEGAGNGCEVE